LWSKDHIFPFCLEHPATTRGFLTQKANSDDIIYPMLRKKYRLSTNFEFNITRKYGKYFSGDFFHAYILKPKNYTGPTKMGIVTSTKLSKIAPKRNRIKRVYREVLKSNLESLGKGNWVVIHPKSNSLDKKYEELNADFTKNLQKISIPH